MSSHLMASGARGGARRDGTSLDQLVKPVPRDDRTITPMRGSNIDLQLGEPLFHVGFAASTKRRDSVKPTLTIAQQCSLLDHRCTQVKG